MCPRPQPAEPFQIVQNRDGSTSWVINLRTRDGGKPTDPFVRVRRRLPSSVKRSDVRAFVADVLRLAREGQLRQWLRATDGRCVDGERKDPAVVVVARLTVAELCARWQTAMGPAWKRSHAQGVASMVRVWIEPEFGDRLADGVTWADVSRWALAMPGSDKSRKLRVQTLATAYAWAIHPARGWLTRNPAEHVEIVNRRPARKPEALTLDEEAAIRKWAVSAGDPWASLVPVALGTGLRKGELVGLRVEDWNDKAGELSIARQVSRAAVATPKHGKSRVVVVVCPMAIEALRGRIRAVGTGYLWPSQTTGTGALDPDTAGQEFGAALSNVVTPARRKVLGAMHCLRHTAATRWRDAGISAETIQLQLGHASGITTARYIHGASARQRLGMLGVA